MKKLYFIFAVLLLSACREREENFFYPASYIFDKIRSEKNTILVVKDINPFSFSEVTAKWKASKRDSFDFLVKKHIDSLFKDENHIESITFINNKELTLNSSKNVKPLKYSSVQGAFLLGDFPNLDYLLNVNPDNSGLTLEQLTTTFFDKSKNKWSPIITNYYKDDDITKTVNRISKFYNLNKDDTLVINKSSFSYKFKK